LQVVDPSYAAVPAGRRNQVQIGFEWLDVPVQRALTLGGPEAKFQA
jgi:hypothetical protein